MQCEQQLEGVVAAAELERLGQVVESIDGDINARLSFERGPLGHLMVSGSADCRVKILCQRCLQPILKEVETQLHWGIVWSEEQGQALPRDLDPVIQDGDELNLYDVLEDELLLSLPMVAYHEDQCVAPDRFLSSDADDPAEGEQRKNPFQVLERLKGSSGKS
ncbi:YceD family protein [Microbulbifer sp. 2201CG32-9]|uniref:YceD family protein n=1 Tax=Microbulbifer sp. 2201CG32-9 TaxID=3232309 RepID=UPI00345C1EB8